MIFTITFFLSEEVMVCYCWCSFWNIHVYVSTCNETCDIFFFVVYDTMGYINTVNQTAEALIASSICEVQNTDSYKDRNGAVSR